MSQPEQTNVTVTGPPSVVAERCRNCDYDFNFALDDGQTISVVAGLPIKVEPYIAVSYVWGEPDTLSILCKACHAETKFPMASREKFVRILDLGRRTGRIWLDALSIDQSDHTEIARQIAKMGDVYKNAVHVAVLLPEEDEAAFKALQATVTSASFLFKHRAKDFALNKDSGASENEESISDFVERNRRDKEQMKRNRELGITAEVRSAPEKKVATTGETCRTFFRGIEKFRDAIRSSKYWSRAWTFQEWVMAKDLWITREGIDGITGDRPSELSAVKSLVLRVAVEIAQYKLSNGQYAEINVGFSRGEVHPLIQSIKSLFPNEDFHLAESELDEEELRMQTLFPHFQTNQILGLRIDYRESEIETFKARLEIMLNAFDISQRKARYEADLVACWASMCNIRYDYSKDDQLAEALRKVMIELRERGLKVYNFVPNTNDPRIDACFLDYAAAHQHSSAANRARLPGTPVFSRVMDHSRHLKNVIQTALNPVIFSQPGPTITVQRLRSSEVVKQVSLSQRDAFIQAFSAAVSARGEFFHQWGSPITPVLPILSEVEKNGNADEFVLEIAAVFGTDKSRSPPTDREIVLWAVRPARYAASSRFVGREGLNNTLVLVDEREDGLSIAGYFVFTDQMCGSQIVEVDDNCMLNLRLIPRLRSDMFSSMDVVDRSISLRVELEDETRVAFGVGSS